MSQRDNKPTIAQAREWLTGGPTAETADKGLKDLHRRVLGRLVRRYQATVEYGSLEAAVQKKWIFLLTGGLPRPGDGKEDYVFEDWFFGVVENELLSDLRRENRRPAWDEAADMRSTRKPSPEETAEFAQIVERIDRYLRDNPDRSQEVSLLMREYRPGEIAAALGRNASTQRTIVQRLRQALSKEPANFIGLPDDGG